MDTDIRIPVTAEQKQLIKDAIASDPSGMAAWARRVLLDAATNEAKKKANEGQAASE